MDPDREHDDSSSPAGSPSTPEPAPSDYVPPVTDAGAQLAADARDAAEPDPADTLSPAVRRLVRQYDLDITGIHGTGPAGKIRVGDVIGLIGGRAEANVRTAETTHDEPQTSPTGPGASAAVDAARAAPTTTVFECDLSCMLSHRKRGRRGEVELSLTTSYFVAATFDALGVVPEVTAFVDRADPLRLGVRLATDGGLRRTLVAPADGSADERLHAIDAQLRASGEDDLGAAQLLVHHYGPSGSLLATPTELGPGHAASVGIGRVRREIVVKTVDGEEAPRVAALCYVTLTFVPERVALERANRFVAELVRSLEHWPSDVDQTV